MYLFILDSLQPYLIFHVLKPIMALILQQKSLKCDFSFDFWGYCLSVLGSTNPHYYAFAIPH